MINGADRRSPIEGIVVRVDARPGQWLGRGSTGVRVDDPKGFRVVALVDEKTRAALAPGKPLPLNGPQGPTAGQVDKIVPGWDKELFYHWVWVKPVNPTGYWPGQQVQVTLAGQK
jgi:multidrug resistance efflux pump